MSRRKKTEQNASASRTELFVDPKPSGGGVFTTPLSVDTGPLYDILGLSAQCERWVRAYKQSQITGRDLQQRLQGELHLLHVHFARVKREFELAAYQLQQLQTTSRQALDHITGNFNEILHIVEESDLGDQYSVESIQDFLDTIEAQPPIGQTDLKPFLSLMLHSQVPQAHIPVDFVDPNLPSAYTAMQQVCLRPVASLESTLAKRL